VLEDEKPREKQQKSYLPCIGAVGLEVHDGVGCLKILQVIADGTIKSHHVVRTPTVIGSIEIEPPILR
jgi:hypothetical protein